MDVVAITNIEELRTEISRLNALESEQKTAVLSRFVNLKGIFKTVLSLFPKSQPASIKSTLRKFLKPAQLLINKLLPKKAVN